MLGLFFLKNVLNVKVFQNLLSNCDVKLFLVTRMSEYKYDDLQSGNAVLNTITTCFLRDVKRYTSGVRVNN